MKVYHGSYIEIKVIDLTKCKPNKDFGQGFYVTNIRSQAEVWAQRLGNHFHTAGIITEFIFNERAYTDNEYNVLRFDSYTDEWLDFVVLNRDDSTTDKRHDFDIVEGPVADDQIALRIDDYLEGFISKATFLEELKFKRPTHQIAFCTLQSLQMLKRMDNKPDINILHIDDFVINSLIADSKLSETIAAELYYSSSTYKNLINENTGLYEKPGMEIYGMFKKELKLKK
jgi:hypothetical protein